MTNPVDELEDDEDDDDDDVAHNQFSPPLNLRSVDEGRGDERAGSGAGTGAVPVPTSVGGNGGRDQVSARPARVRSGETRSRACWVAISPTRFDTRPMVYPRLAP